MREIKKNGVVLARHIFVNDFSDSQGFFSKNDEFIQVGAWKYDSGKNINSHIHNRFSRSVNRTCEVLYVISGALKVRIYDLDKQFVEEFTVKMGETLILLECGHGYNVLEDNTRVLEVKNGPYFGAEHDRERF